MVGDGQDNLPAVLIRHLLPVLTTSETKFKKFLNKQHKWQCKPSGAGELGRGSRWYPHQPLAGHTSLQEDGRVSVGPMGSWARGTPGPLKEEGCGWWAPAQTLGLVGFFYLFHARFVDYCTVSCWLYSFNITDFINLKITSNCSH